MRRWVIIGIVALLVVGGAVVFFSSSGSSSSSKPLLITAVAVPRDLRDEVTVQGTLERVEERTINSVSEASQVSKVFLEGRRDAHVQRVHPRPRRTELGDDRRLDRVLPAPRRRRGR